MHQVLSNEKYIGNNVFNRRSFKLKQQRVKNPPEQWVRAEGAFIPIIDLPTYQAAQAIIIERSRRFSNEEMIDHLKTLHARHGMLSAIIIDEARGGPSSGAIRHRFGSLLRAYELVGFTPDRDYRYIEINRVLRRLHPQILADAITGIEAAGGRVEKDRTTDILTNAMDYYIFPARDGGAPRLRLGEYNGVALDAFRFDTIDPLFDMASRIGLLEVA